MEKALNWKRHKLMGEAFRDPRECNVIIIGVGGCGNNTVSRLMKDGLNGAECIAINTDVQHLSMVTADKKILIGENSTKGLGAGNITDLGREAMLNGAYHIERLVAFRDIVFIAAGLGGGTGTGAAPVIAELCRRQGAIVIGVITMPFRHEKGRYELAVQGLKELRSVTHTTVIIDNNKLMDLVPQLPLDNAFGVADSILSNMVKGVVETIADPSLINLDFADFKTIMTEGDIAIVGMGQSNSPNRAEVAAVNALNHMMLDVNIREATGALIHVSGGSDMSLGEAVRAAETITDNMSDGSMVIWGSRVDPDLGDQMRVTLVLTGVKSPHLVGGNEIEEKPIYNLEPFAGPEKSYDLGIDLYDIESSWK